MSTELLARGMDIPDLEVVVNFDVPHLPEEYIHRVGRTGRMEKEGLAITLVSSTPIVTTVAKRYSLPLRTFSQS